jgi:hypothetical protein
MSLSTKRTLSPLAHRWLSANWCAKVAAAAPFDCDRRLAPHHRRDRAEAEREILSAMREMGVEAFIHGDRLFEVGKPPWPGCAPRLDVTHLYHSHELELPPEKPEPAPDPEPSDDEVRDLVEGIKAEYVRASLEIGPADAALAFGAAFDDVFHAQEEVE